MHKIDLRSDTMTKPCDAMRKVIESAIVGDDCYGEDPTVRDLEQACADLFGKEEALFMVSGTMSNQVALKAHTSPGDEVIIHERYHIYYYESAPSSAFSGIHFNVVNQPGGSIRASDVRAAISSKPRSDVYAKVSLLVLENTICSLAGRIIPYEELQEASECARSNGVSVHIDGARILNACAVNDLHPKKYGTLADSITMCFSKGLGAPMGSMLMGSSAFIKRARRFRKWFGGGMHQAGLMAAACRFALERVGIQQLKNDHQKAMVMYRTIEGALGPEAVCKPDSNMLLLDCRQLGVDAQPLVEHLRSRNVLCLPWDGYAIRAVLHRDISEVQAQAGAEIIAQTIEKMAGAPRGAILKIAAPDRNANLDQKANEALPSKVSRL